MASIHYCDNGGNSGGSSGRNRKNIDLIQGPALLKESRTNILGNYLALVWFGSSVIIMIMLSANANQGERKHGMGKADYKK